MLHLLRQQGYEGIVCAMSGHFVQRGEAAVVGKLARAEMALRCGADLVLEIPTPWAAAAAETLARGGVALLRATGVVDELAFGAECADITALQAVADALDSPAYEEALRAVPDGGETFAARRQRAVAAVLDPERAALLEQPNNILAVEYLRQLRGTGIAPVAVPRKGAAHDAADPEGEVASASHVRGLLRTGRTEEALAFLPESAAQILRREMTEGRAPADMTCGERAILSRLRRMSEDDWRACDTGGEGLYHRLCQAAQKARSLQELLELAKTKRYPMARLRRMALAAWLELPTPPAEMPYIRLLGANETGRRLLRRMKGAPVLTKAADVAALGPAAEELFRRESAWSDQYALLCPGILPCGEDWRTTPVMRSEEK